MLDTCIGTPLLGLRLLEMVSYPSWIASTSASFPTKPNVFAWCSCGSYCPVAGNGRRFINPRHVFHRSLDGEWSRDRQLCVPHSLSRFYGHVAAWYTESSLRFFSIPTHCSCTYGLGIHTITSSSESGTTLARDPDALSFPERFRYAGQAEF